MWLGQLERCILFHSFDLTKLSLKTNKEDNEIYNGNTMVLTVAPKFVSVGKKCVKEDKLFIHMYGYMIKSWFINRTSNLVIRSSVDK